MPPVLCNICKDHVTIQSETMSVTSCGHAYHESCLISWLSISETCPTCRVSQTASQMQRLFLNISADNKRCHERISPRRMSHQDGQGQPDVSSSDVLEDGYPASGVDRVALPVTSKTIPNSIHLGNRTATFEMVQVSFDLKEIQRELDARQRILTRIELRVTDLRRDLDEFAANVDAYSCQVRSLKSRFCGEGETGYYFKRSLPDGRIHE